MPAFCGQDLCLLDANGRVKLSPRLLADFAGACSGDVVLHCLPEGAIGIYPPAVFEKMRASSADPSNAGESLLRRRMLRRSYILHRQRFPEFPTAQKTRRENYRDRPMKF